MNLPANSYKTRNSRSKLPLQVELTGNVGELVAAEFKKFNEEMEEMKKLMEEQMQKQKTLLEQVVANTKYPMKPYTVEDFEAMFGLKNSAQRNYRKVGKLGFMKLGEKVFYTHQHIQDFIQLHDSSNQEKKD